MKSFLPLLAAASVALVACGDTTSDRVDDVDGVVIEVENVTGTGTVYVALQAEDIFGGPNATFGATAAASDAVDGDLEVLITGVAPGDYAIAAFQDVNGNGQLDMGGNGVPSEPWALSNGAGTMGAPTFADAEISFGGIDDRETVTLNR